LRGEPQREGLAQSLKHGGEGQKLRAES
jgi:hypothetical protein